MSSAYANPNYMANALFVTARYNVQRRMERMDCAESKHGSSLRASVGTVGRSVLLGADIHDYAGAASSPKYWRLRDGARTWSADQPARDRCADTTRNNLALRRDRATASLASTESLSDKLILIKEKHQVTFQGLQTAGSRGGCNKVISSMHQSFLWNLPRCIIAVRWME